MITAQNLGDVIKLLSARDIKRIQNTDKEYVVLYLHSFNVGSTASCTVTNDFNRYKNASNKGNLMLETADVRQIIEENNV